MDFRWRKVLPTVAAFALLTACGQDGGDDNKVASISSAGPSSAAAPADTGGSDEDKMRAYVKCMREHGIDMPDPDTSDGEIRLALPEGSDKSKVDAAGEACKSLMPNGGAPKQLSPEDLDKQRAMAKCLREHGVDVPDPTPEDPGIKLQANGDTEKAKLDAAHEACKGLAPGGGTFESKVDGQ